MENLILKNGLIAKFKYFSDFDNPIFEVCKNEKTYKITIIDDRLYSVCGDDEPSTLLKEEYQAKIFKTKTYDFFKGQFMEKQKRGA